MAGPAQRGTLLRPVLPGVPAAYYLIAQEVPVRSHGTSVLAATLDTKRPKPRGDGGSVEVHRLAPAARTLQLAVVDGDSSPCGETATILTMADTSASEVSTGSMLHSRSPGGQIPAVGLQDLAVSTLASHRGLVRVSSMGDKNWRLDPDGPSLPDAGPLAGARIEGLWWHDIPRVPRL